MGPGEDPNGYWEVNHMKHTIRTKALALLTVGLMLLVLGGWAPAPADMKIVEVATVDELLAAIGPNVTVALQPGEYDFAAAATYGKATGNPCCRWDATAEQGFELYVTGVDGLTLRGAGMDETTLLAEDRYANVLTIANSRNVTVSGITAGHDPAPGYCSGGVLHFVNCGTVTVEGCGLFGCGTTGVWTMNCSDVTVTGSRIYECSDSAVYADGCWNVQVLDSEIDHNGWKNDTPASCLFQSYGGDGFTVSDCRVHDNSAYTLFECNNTRNACFLTNKVEYNALQSAFTLRGIPAVVGGCAFHGNDLYTWFGDSSLAALDPDGNELTAIDLAAMQIRPVQYADMEIAPLKEPTPVPPGGEITVTNADEFLAAIGPDRTIVVSESFCLADAADYGSDEGLYYRWETCYDGPQLVISGVYDLTIRGAKADGSTTVTAVPRYANVIGFTFCDNVTIADLTLGHSDGTSECSGDVLDFENCNGITLDGCRLYGCGTLGVNAWYCTELQLTDCEIYDCSIGGVVLGSVYDVTFENCSIHDVPSPAISLYGCDEVMWNNADVSGEHFDVSKSGNLIPVTIG